MKIVKRGVDWHQVTCNGCRSELAIDESDIVAIAVRDEDNAIIYQGTVKCAVCERRISLLNVPVEILERRERYLNPPGFDDIP